MNIRPLIWPVNISLASRRFENAFGVFDYRNIKQDGFFGYRATAHGSADILVAEPEKALIDHWHHTAGEWTTPRLEEMRYQHMGVIAEARLMSYAERFRGPRLDRAVARWLALAAEEQTETVTL